MRDRHATASRRNLAPKTRKRFILAPTFGDRASAVRGKSQFTRKERGAGDIRAYRPGEIPLPAKAGSPLSQSYGNMTTRFAIRAQDVNQVPGVHSRFADHVGHWHRRYDGDVQ